MGGMAQDKQTRRQLFEFGAVLLGGAGLASAGAGFKKPIGVQLYTVREILPKDPAQTLKAIEKIGYTEVEVLGEGFPSIEALLKKDKLTAVSGHFGGDMILKPDWDAWKKAVDVAHRGGLKYMVMPYVPVSDRGGLDFFRSFADKLNQAGAITRHAGIKMAYHNHCFEFKPTEGKVPLDVLMERLDPKLVGLEMDVFWVSVGGHDPVERLKKYTGRVPLVHLKDKAKGTPVQYNENVPGQDFMAVGSGTLDFPAILKAAEAAGVQHYFVEQDHTPGNPLDSLRKSFEYLRGAV